MATSLRKLFGKAAGDYSLGILPADTVSGTTYTVTFGDLNRSKRFTNAAAVGVTLPSDIPVGFTSTLRQVGAGAFTLIPGSGVTAINSPYTLVSAGPGSTVFIHKVSATEWDVTGGLL